MQNGDEAMPSINLAGRGLLVKMIITLEPHHIFYQILHTYTFLKLAGEMAKKRKENIRHAGFCAPGCWISWPPHIVHMLVVEQKTGKKSLS